MQCFQGGSAETKVNCQTNCIHSGIAMSTNPRFCLTNYETSDSFYVRSEQTFWKMKAWLKTPYGQQELFKIDLLGFDSWVTVIAEVTNTNETNSKEFPEEFVPGSALQKWFMALVFRDFSVMSVVFGPSSRQKKRKATIFLLQKLQSKY